MQGRQRQQRSQALTRLLLVGALLLSLLAACATERTTQRRREEQKTLLTDSAKAYWSQLRWGRLEKVVEWVEEGPERGQLWDYLLSRRGRATLSEVDVYRVELAEDQKSGKAFVTYQLIMPDQESVQERRVEQDWYLKRGKWYLKFGPDELKRLE